MHTSATGERNQREASRGKQGGRTLEIQRLVRPRKQFTHPATERRLFALGGNTGAATALDLAHPLIRGGGADAEELMEIRRVNSKLKRDVDAIAAAVEMNMGGSLFR